MGTSCRAANGQLARGEGEKVIEVVTEDGSTRRLVHVDRSAPHAAGGVEAGGEVPRGLLWAEGVLPEAPRGRQEAADPHQTWSLHPQAEE
eukprot:173017-Pyramimonas_sp.AAC.1